VPIYFYDLVHTEQLRFHVRDEESQQGFELRPLVRMVMGVLRFGFDPALLEFA